MKLAKVVSLICLVNYFSGASTIPVVYSKTENVGAFLRQMTRFVKWPRLDSTFNVYISDCNYRSMFLESCLRLQNRPVKIVNDVSLSNLAILNESDEYSLIQIKDKPILTVCSSEHMFEKGAMIYLMLEDNKIKFEVNLKRVKESNLEISSKMLKLARKIDA